MSNAIEIKNLTKNYKNFSLKGINLTLPQGCIMGVIGENGAGKSTTIKLILDLIKKDEGQIFVLGENLSKNSVDLKENIGVVLDENNFPENLTVKNINKIMKNIFKTWEEDKFKQYVSKFDFPYDMKVKELSRGMKVKLAISTALSHDSKLLILDEATSGLDPVVRDELLDMLLEFIQDENHSILISSHITSDLEKICDYITFMHKGKIVFSETKDDVLENYELIKCTKEDFAKIKKECIKGYRENAFGMEVLVYKNEGEVVGVKDKVRLEDIMLFYRGNN